MNATLADVIISDNIINKYHFGITLGEYDENSNDLPGFALC